MGAVEGVRSRFGYDNSYESELGSDARMTKVDGSHQGPDLEPLDLEDRGSDSSGSLGPPDARATSPSGWTAPSGSVVLAVSTSPARGTTPAQLQRQILASPTYSDLSPQGKADVQAIVAKLQHHPEADRLYYLAKLDQAINTPFIPPPPRGAVPSEREQTVHADIDQSLLADRTRSRASLTDWTNSKNS